MVPTVYLVSGANRGIGLGFVTALAARDDVIVFAGARNPASAKDLHTLEKKYSGKVHVVKLTSCDKADNEAAVSLIKATAGRLDVVIANAGIGKFYGPALETPPEEMREHYEVNVIGTLMLFQATYLLLKASTPSPKFMPISSGAGTLSRGAAFPASVLAYGASKAAENYLARKLHFEHEGLICFPLSPGATATDLMAYAASQEGFIKGLKTMTVEESVKGMLAQIDNGTREKQGGTFIHYDGSQLDW